MADGLLGATLPILCAASPVVGFTRSARVRGDGGLGSGRAADDPAVLGRHFGLALPGLSGRPDGMSVLTGRGGMSTSCSVRNQRIRKLGSCATKA